MSKGTPEHNYAHEVLRKAEKLVRETESLPPIGYQAGQFAISMNKVAETARNLLFAAQQGVIGTDKSNKPPHHQEPAGQEKEIG